MDAVRYLKESERRCDSFDDRCTGCEIKSAKNGMTCGAYIKKYPEQAVDIVEKWSEEHPQETYLTKLLKHFPNVELNSNGIPTFCPSVLGLENWCEKTRTGNCPCAECWNRPIEEEE